MGRTQLRRPWTEQPQVAAGLGGFLTRPEFVFVASQAHDFVSGSAWTVESGGVPVEARPSGLARTFSSGGNVALNRTGGVAATQTQCTFVLVYTPRSGSAVTQQFAGLSSTSSGFLLASTGNAATSIGLTKGNVTNLPQITLTAGVTYVVITSHDQASGQYYIVARPISGGAEVRASTTSTTSSIAGSGTYRVGGARSDVASANADIFLCAGAFVFEPEQKLRSLLDNPWLIFADRTIPIPLAAAAGGGLPTLSNARATSITTTTAVPAVDYAY